MYEELDIVKIKEKIVRLADKLFKIIGKKGGSKKIGKKKIWFRIFNEAIYINSIRFLYEATGFLVLISHK
jgi:hypothetical protein